VDIKKYENHFPSELSGGQQQRVSIARALIKNPKILLCDELTGALDSKSARLVLKFIEEVNKKFHTTIIIITHNEAIAGMADRIIRIKDGQVSSNKENSNKQKADELAL
jgi:putative ABC transport system ATP-binding protein